MILMLLSMLERMSIVSFGLHSFLLLCTVKHRCFCENNSIIVVIVVVIEEEIAKVLLLEVEVVIDPLDQRTCPICTSNM